MYLHQSLNTEKFKNNKKLNMLKQHKLTVNQFLSLIESTDPFMIIGNAIIDRDYMDDYIKEWKAGKHDVQHIEEQESSLTLQEIINNISIIKHNFPEFQSLYSEFDLALSNTLCQPCVKNKYVFAIINKVHDTYKDKKDQLSEQDKNFILSAIKKYYPIDDLEEGIINLEEQHKFDITWVEDDSLIGIGYDLIKGLNHCFECTKKHLTRSKIFFEELLTGYPNYKTMLFNEFTEANATIEKAYVLWWDSIGQLDMSSSELIGQITDLPIDYRMELIELANKIRFERLKFQENILNVPDWDKLRVDLQKLQNKINKAAQK